MICGPNDFSIVAAACPAAPSRPGGCGLPADGCRSASVAELRLGLHPHLVGAAELVEVVHIGRAEVGLQRAEDVVSGMSSVLTLRGRRPRTAAARRRGTWCSAPQGPIGVRGIFDHVLSRPAQARAVRRRRGPRLHLEAAATPRPRIAGGGNGKMIASWICAELAAQACRGSHPAEISSSVRSSQGLKVTNIVAAFGADCCRRESTGRRWRTSLSTPGVLPRISSICSITLRVRSCDAASGNCTPTKHVALVLGRQEAGRQRAGTTNRSAPPGRRRPAASPPAMAARCDGRSRRRAASTPVVDPVEPRVEEVLAAAWAAAARARTGPA